MLGYIKVKINLLIPTLKFPSPAAKPETQNGFKKRGKITSGLNTGIILGK